MGKFRFVDKDRSMNVFKEMYQSHKFFCRKSQHYCLGGPKAYCKFMWYELKDYIRYNFKK